MVSIAPTAGRKQEPDSIPLIHSDWLFSPWNYFTNGRTWFLQ